MRRGRICVVVLVAVLCTGLITLAAALGGGGAQGQPAPTVPIGATVYPPFGLALQPGQSITVPGNTPTPAPTVPPATTPGRGFAPPPQLGTAIARFDVQIVNDSDTQITVLGDGNNFTVTAYDGSIVQLTTRHELVRQSAVSGLSTCGPDDALANVVRCRGIDAAVFNASQPVGGPVVLHVTTVPQGTTDQQLDLASGDTAFLVWPQADTTTGPAISLQNATDSTASIDWDGATLTAAIAANEAIDGSVRNRFPPGGGGSLADSGCTTATDPSSVSCPISGQPQQDIAIRSLPLAPTETLTLPYTDRYSDGTLTLTPSGPDSAPGAEAFSVNLSAGGAEFDGSGVLRPEPYNLAEYQLLFALTDGSGATWYAEGALREIGGVWAGRGQIAEASQPAGVSSWIVGDSNAAASVSTGPSVSARLADQHGEPGGPLSPPLPTSTPPGATAALVGSAGTPIGFEVLGQMPLVGGQETFGMDFGDGTQPQESAQQGITHTFAAPGTYTLLTYIIDSTGQRTFGVTQITIGPATN